MKGILSFMCVCVFFYSGVYMAWWIRWHVILGRFKIFIEHFSSRLHIFEMVRINDQNQWNVCCWQQQTHHFLFVCWQFCFAVSAIYFNDQQCLHFAFNFFFARSLSLALHILHPLFFSKLQKNADPFNWCAIAEAIVCATGLDQFPFHTLKKIAVNKLKAIANFRLFTQQQQQQQKKNSCFDLWNWCEESLILNKFLV